MRLRNLLADESGQVIRRVITFGLIFALVVLVIVEVGPLIWERFTVSQMADDLANAAANSYRAYHDSKAAVDEVADKLRLGGYTEEEIGQCTVVFLPTVGPKTSVKVTVVKYANTLVTKHISPLKKFSKITGSKEVAIVEAK